MAKLRLKDVRLVGLAFNVSKDFSESEDGLEFRFDFGISGSYDKDRNEIKVELRVSTPDSTQAAWPFLFDVRMVGLFEADIDLEDTVIDQFVRVNCPAIIFPYVREIVSNLTQRAGFPPLYLPVINFVKHAEQTFVAEEKDKDKLVSSGSGKGRGKRTARKK
jgi:preprotein translocase subunit SecB